MSPDRASDRYTLLDRAEEAAQVGSWEWDIATDRLLWSDNLYRIFGLAPDEITPTVNAVVERTHPDDQDRVTRALGVARRDGRLQPLECRIVRPDGSVRHLRALQPMIEELRSRRRRLVGSVQDVTDWRSAERQVAAHLAVAESLAEWEDFECGAVRLLQNLAVALDCEAGVLWVPRDDALIAQAFWRSRSADASGFESELQRLHRCGSASLDTVWRTKQPSVPADARSDDSVLDEAQSRVAIPALDGDEVLGVLEFFAEPGRGDMSDRVIDSLTGIAHELGQFLSRHRGELRPRSLTARELEVLQLATQGLSTHEIGAQLVISRATVKTHFEHIYAKLGVSDRVAAVAQVLRDGLIR